jgi:hypothetical protein
MKTYSEKLKDPRWQKRRLEILSKNEFACEVCGDDEETLHVHHIIYHHKRDPWNYEDNELQCLCEQCHKEIEEFIKRSTEAIRKNAFFDPFRDVIDKCISLNIFDVCNMLSNFEELKPLSDSITKLKIRAMGKK